MIAEMISIGFLGLVIKFGYNSLKDCGFTKGEESWKT